MIAEAIRLYIPPGEVILDVTYGAGGFWKCIRPTGLVGSDIEHRTGITVQADLRQLPYRDGSAGCGVLDPPYMENSSQTLKFGRKDLDPYRRNEVTWAVVRDLYQKGLTEMFRVLWGGGYLFLKVQDCGTHRRSIEVRQMALDLGFQDVDQFILMQNGHMPIQGRQAHARKNHSVLWVFRKPRRTAAVGPLCPNGDRDLAAEV